MKYLKDKLNGAVRQFDEANPRQKAKYDKFKKIKTYDFEDGKAVEGGKRWETATKADYDKFTGKKVAIDK